MYGRMIYSLVYMGLYATEKYCYSINKDWKVEDRYCFTHLALRLVVK